MFLFPVLPVSLYQIFVFVSLLIAVTVMTRSGFQIELRRIHQSTE
jgi:hypothetical protein